MGRSAICPALYCLGMVAGPVAAEDLLHPPHAVVQGKTLQEWGAIWWQWALASPKDQNPLLDTGGQFCAVGQPEAVFFLASGGVVERTCQVPEGRDVFFPVNSIVVWNSPTGQTFTCDELAAAAAGVMDQVTVAECTIDGLSQPDVLLHREAFNCFELNIDKRKEVNAVNQPAGCYSPSASDGYYLMLKPLPPGEHTLFFESTRTRPSAPSLHVQLTYHLTVGAVTAEYFRRGDTDGNGTIDLTDVVNVLSYLFLGGDALACPDAADFDDGGVLDLTDAVNTLNWLYLGGCPPAWPGPYLCADDVIPDGLGACARKCN